MKKHEACHFLNEIILRTREDIERYEEMLANLPDLVKRRGKEPSAENIADESKWITKTLERLRDEEEALDVAASSLTKEPPKPRSERFWNSRRRDSVEPDPVDPVIREAVIATGGVP